MQTRAIIVIGIIASVVLFVVGILIGHFAISKSDSEYADDGKYLDIQCESTTFDSKSEKYRKGYLQHAVDESCNKETCNTEDLPRTYISYHLNGQTINIDGKLDDPAWEQVPWTDSFMDIRGPDYPKPYFDTKVKVRWDNDRLYVGARMEETHFWGTLTEDESLVWTENAFEVYAVPDGSLHNYKEMQISVLNVTWDLMLKKAYMDFGSPCDNSSAWDSSWDSDMQKATFTDGVINDPNSSPGTFWSAEWSFSFAKLAEQTDRALGRSTPVANEAWFFIFARPEYKYMVENGQYVKNESAATEWWSWQPMYTVNLHLPSRFGLVQFKRDMTDKTFVYEKWHLYRALFEVFEAEHKYKSVNNMFIDDLTQLAMAPKIMSSSCVSLTVTLSDDTFIATAVSKINNNLPAAHIRADRYRLVAEG